MRVGERRLVYWKRVNKINLLKLKGYIPQTRLFFDSEGDN